MDVSTIDPTLAAQAFALLQSIPYLGKLAVYVPPIITTAAILDMFLPVPPAGSVWVWPRTVLHWVAFNFYKARNATPAGSTPAGVGEKAAEVAAAIATVKEKTSELDQVAKGKPEASAAAETLRGTLNNGDSTMKALLPVAGAILAGLTLSACDPSKVAAVQTTAASYVVQGQLYCAKATALGPLVAAVATASGAPIVATGKAKAEVDRVCGAIDGVAVSPPANPGAAPKITIPAIVIS